MAEVTASHRIASHQTSRSKHYTVYYEIGTDWRSFGVRGGNIDIGVYCWLYVHYNQAVILLCSSANTP